VKRSGVIEHLPALGRETDLQVEIDERPLTAEWSGAPGAAVVSTSNPISESSSEIRATALSTKSSTLRANIRKMFSASSRL